MNRKYIAKTFGAEGKVVLVTGSNGQLGGVICDAFNKAGATVLGADLDDQSKVKNLSKYYSIDIVKKNNLENVFNDIFTQHKQLDILINNAGVSTFEHFEERSEEKFDWVMDVNLKGTFNCIHNFVNFFDEYGGKRGSVVNIASIYGFISPDFRLYTDCDRKNSEVYGATKAGIIQMTKYFAVHLADRNIRVNSVSPGGIYNQYSPQGDDFIKNYSFRCPMKRMAKDGEMVGAILYLSSESASYTTGTNIVIDGGMSCW
ncbi:MAG: SDR family oxidoreductase [Bacteroidetes bacterium]|nr:SDR family oxidoreductase [Bacteroidota bacterium]